MYSSDSGRRPSRREDPAQFADASGFVAFAMPCPFCRYNLNGLRLGGLCTEGGEPIGFAHNPRLLCNASPDWLRQVRLGIVLCWIALILTAVGMLIILPLGAAQIQSATRRSDSPITSMMGLFRFASCGMFLTAAIRGFGVWFLTSRRDPSGPDIAKFAGSEARRLLLVFWCLYPILELLTTVTGESFPFLAVLGLVTSVLSNPILVAAFRHASWLFWQVPDAAWSRRATLMSWFMVGLTVLAAASVVFSPLMVSGGAIPSTPYAMPMGRQFLLVESRDASSVVTTVPRAGRSTLRSAARTACHADESLHDFRLLCQCRVCRRSNVALGSPVLAARCGV